MCSQGRDPRLAETADGFVRQGENQMDSHSLRESLASMIQSDNEVFHFTLWCWGVGMQKIRDDTSSEPEMMGIMLRIIGKLSQFGVH